METWKSTRSGEKLENETKINQIVSFTSCASVYSTKKILIKQGVPLHRAKPGHSD